MSEFTPSRYQEAIFSFHDHGEGDAFVSAVAGSGKTTTLVQLANRLSPYARQNAAFVAFNRHIVAELERRLPSNFTVRTIHSLAYSALRKLYKWSGEPVDTRKYNKIAEDFVKDWMSEVPDAEFSGEELADNLANAASKMRLTLTDPTDDFEEDVNQPLWDICDRFGIEVLHPGAMAKGVKYLLEIGRKIADQKIDIDDMIWLGATDPALRPWAYDVLLVDECQDLNRAQQEFILRIQRGRAFLVGDEKQCQPAGTMVTRRTVTSAGRHGRSTRENTPIECLEVGDMVVSYSQGDCSFIQNGRRVRQIQRRPFCGELITATVGEFTSRYTPNHLCLVNFGSLRDKWCVYMMRRGRKYRIGRARMDYVHTSGPIMRARSEEADAIWILDVYDSEADASMWEHSISGKHGISELVFQSTSIKSACANQEALDRAWAYIGDQTERAQDCLRAFGRDIAYPLWTPSLNGQFSLKRPQGVHACNLISGVLMLPYSEENHVRASQWQPATIGREPYVGDVYSLDVEGEQLYIADGIVTHNSIYGFAGADVEAVKTLQNRTGAERLPLSICYRCPQSHIRLAQQIVPEIEWAENAKEGVISHIPRGQANGHLKDGAPLVLCRTTQPLIELCFNLIRDGVPATVKGRDIGKSLTTLVDAVAKHKGFDWKAFPEWLETHCMQRIKLLGRRKQDSQIQALNDKWQTVALIHEKAVAEGVDSQDEFKSYTQALFSEEAVAGAPTLSTVHKAKGLEADHVYLLKSELMPHPMAKRAHEIEQEWNIRYIALTRSKNALTFIDEVKGADRYEVPRELPKVAEKAVEPEVVRSLCVPEWEYAVRREADGTRTLTRDGQDYAVTEEDLLARFEAVR